MCVSITANHSIYPKRRIIIIPDAKQDVNRFLDFFGTDKINAICPLSRISFQTKKKHRLTLRVGAFERKKLVRHIRNERHLARAFDRLGELPLMSCAGAGCAAG